MFTEVFLNYNLYEFTSFPYRFWLNGKLIQTEEHKNKK